jgi:hypothetical protein
VGTESSIDPHPTIDSELMRPAISSQASQGAAAVEVWCMAALGACADGFVQRDAGLWIVTEEAGKQLTQLRVGKQKAKLQRIWTTRCVIECYRHVGRMTKLIRAIWMKKSAGEIEARPRIRSQEGT